MYRFNNNNLFTGYIKQLLAEFNLPNIHVFAPGDKVFEGCHYIYQNKLLKAKKTIKTEVNPNVADDTSIFKYIDHYRWNDEISNITKNANISTLTYDSYTHAYLGNYLRFLRDYKYFDLMSMYNCYSDESPKRLEQYVNNSLFTSNDIHYNIFMIPVKYFKKYSIFIDCPTSIEMFCGLYSNDSLLQLSDVLSLYENTYQKKSGLRFTTPFIYDKLVTWGDNITTLMYNQENNLKLFLKIPKNIKSSLVILEGDYAIYKLTENNGETQEKQTRELDFVFDDDGFYQVSNQKIYSRPSEWNKLSYEAGREAGAEIGNPEVTETMLHIKYQNQARAEYRNRRQLTNLNDGVSYPFSDRLVEYLMENVISKTDIISQNIGALQVTLNERDDQDIALQYILARGKWDPGIRNVLYDIANKENLINTKYDILGYCDKSIEKIIGELDLDVE